MSLSSGNPSLKKERCMRQHSILRLASVTLALSMNLGGMLPAQVGKGPILDLNTAAEKELLALSPLTPAIVKGLIEKRPFGSIVEANSYLTAQSLTPAQLTELYGKAFVHVNLNTGTREEILLIPGAGTRMVREFAEYRPWKSWGQFDKEISKYVGQPETDRLKQYVFIPVNLNTASDEDILSIPGAGARMVREFKEYRPWKTKEQFDREIGKYVNAKETARLWRYVVIQ
jgi:DNA uptake protein ComE-like DNA-binding protein